MDLIETIAMSTIRAFLNNSIKKFSDTDLILAIQNNRDLWEATPSTFTNFGSGLKKRFGQFLPKYFEKITTDLMLNQWLQKDRPSFAMTIKTTPGGYTWFDNQVNNIKQKILTM